MGRRVTLNDIARRVGVSTSAVSLALRGEARVSPETAERIRSEAVRLGYIYNRAAAGLRTAQSDVVAVGLSDLTNPVMNEFLIHIEDELRRHGRTVILGVARESLELQRSFIHKAMEQGVSGLLLCPVHASRAGDLGPLLSRPGGMAAAPCVLYSRAISGAPLPQFVNDDDAAGRLMARALLDAGHRDVLWLGGGQETSTARGRWAGLAATFAEAGLPEPERRVGETSRRFGYEAAREALQRTLPPTAIACFSDLIAFGALAACNALSRTPGRDVSIVGCDDMEEARYTHPPLATVAVDKSGIGRAAARALVGMIEGGAVPEGCTRTQPRFVARASLGPARS